MSTGSASLPGGPTGVSLRAVGDSALIVEFGDTLEPALVARVQALDRAISLACDTGALPGIVERVPTFRSLAIVLDPLITTARQVADGVRPLIGDTDRDTGPTATRQWCLPVRYGDEHGPDLGSLALTLGMDEQEVVTRHGACPVSVFMLGFLPGFAFMGTTDPLLQQPRRSEPRLRVPAGSVALAMQLTAVYPWDSPGGWHLIGHCPVPLFDADADSPVLLGPGDRVSFRAVDDQEHQQLCADRAAGNLQVERFLDRS